MFTHPQVSSEADGTGSWRWLPRPGTSLGRRGTRLINCWRYLLPAALLLAALILFAAASSRSGSDRAHRGAWPVHQPAGHRSAQPGSPAGPAP